MEIERNSEFPGNHAIIMTTPHRFDIILSWCRLSWTNGSFNNRLNAIILSFQLALFHMSIDKATRQRFCRQIHLSEPTVKHSIYSEMVTLKEKERKQRIFTYSFVDHNETSHCFSFRFNDIGSIVQSLVPVATRWMTHLHWVIHERLFPWSEFNPLWFTPQIRSTAVTEAMNIQQDAIHCQMAPELRSNCQLDKDQTL